MRPKTLNDPLDESLVPTTVLACRWALSRRLEPLVHLQRAAGAFRTHVTHQRTPLPRAFEVSSGALLMNTIPRGTLVSILPDNASDVSLGS